MSASKIFDKLYADQITWLTKKQENVRYIQALDDESRKSREREIQDLQKQLNNGKLSKKKSEELKGNISLLKLLLKKSSRGDTVKPSRPITEIRELRILADDDSNRTLVNWLSHSLDMTLQINSLIKSIVEKFNLGMKEEATLKALHVMWQPHQRVERPIDMNLVISRTLLEAKRRKSPVAKELNTVITYRPMVRREVSDEEAAKEQEVLDRGKPYWRFVPYFHSYTAKVKDILDHFGKLRPFLSEKISEEIGIELIKLLDSHGLKRVLVLTVYHADVRLPHEIATKMKIFAPDGDYSNLENLWRYQGGDVAKISESEIIDFSIVKMDEMFDNLRVKRGRDAYIMKLINTMSGRDKLVKNSTHIAIRRRDLKKKVRWKQYTKMRNFESG